MDQRYELNGIMFVWDEAKARTNLSKHEITFEQAIEAFFDPFFRVVDASPETEARKLKQGTLLSAWMLPGTYYMSYT